MSNNIHNFNDYESRNSNASTNNSNNQFGMGGYDQSGKYNPWQKQNQQPQLQQQRGYAQLDGQQSQSQSMLSGMNLTLRSFAAINLILVWVIFIICKSIAYISSENQYNCILFQSGAQYQPSITYKYHFHRYILPIYLHGSFSHILSNSFGLFFYAFQLESQYGLKKFIFYYLLCGFGGNLLSGYNSPLTLSVGASSSLFGLFPLMILFLAENQNIQKNQKIFYIVYIAIMVFANFFGSNGQNQLDNGDESQRATSANPVDSAAHLGGLLTGVLLSVLYSDYQHPKMRYAKMGSIGLLAIGLTFLFIYNQVNYSLPNPEGMENACRWK